MAEYICLPTCLSVCLSVSLSVYQNGILVLVSDLYKLRHCLGLNITFSEASQVKKKEKKSQNNPNWSTQRNYVVVTLDHPGSSAGEHVCPVFQGL